MPIKKKGESKKEVWQKAWKVCRVEGNKFLSLYSYVLDGLTVRYEIGKIAVPKAGLLFACTTLEEAKDIVIGSDKIIMEVEAVIEKTCLPTYGNLMSPTETIQDEKIKDDKRKFLAAARKWWKYFLRNDPHERLPEGVHEGWGCSIRFHLCSKIRPVKVVEVKHGL